MSAIIGRLATKFLLPGLGLKELVDLIQGEADPEAKAAQLSASGVTSRFAIVDLQSDTVIKFISAKKALLMSTTRRKRCSTKTKTVLIDSKGCPITV